MFISNETKKVILIIADISGYTSYMVAHRAELEHGQVLITELLEAIIGQAEIPIEISKLEGDAVFMYAAAADGETGLDSVAPGVSKKLLKFFDAFSEKLGELVESSVCCCKACANLDKLRLKLIIHSGEALFHRVGNFNELAGVDVITLHRLLKNGVDSNHYIMMTESAHGLLDFEKKSEMSEIVESYSEIGNIRNFVYYMDGRDRPETTPAPRSKTYSTLYHKAKTLIWLVTRSMLLRLGLVKGPELKNIAK